MILLEYVSAVSRLLLWMITPSTIAVSTTPKRSSLVMPTPILRIRVIPNNIVSERIASTDRNEYLSCLSRDQIH